MKKSKIAIHSILCNAVQITRYQRLHFWTWIVVKVATKGKYKDTCLQCKGLVSTISNMAICIAEYIMLCYVFSLYLSIPTHMNKLNNTPINFSQHKKGENTGNILIYEWELIHTDIFTQSYYQSCWWHFHSFHLGFCQITQPDMIHTVCVCVCVTSVCVCAKLQSELLSFLKN